MTPLVTGTEPGAATDINPGGSGNFAELVSRHQAMVFSLAYHYLRDYGAAEELAQEVFLQLYEHLDEMKSPAHTAHWLRKVTCHRCIDWARRRSCRPDASEISLAVAPEQGVEGDQGDPILADKLRKLVASLPDRLRIVVILHFQEDLDADEIAETLDMPVSTVRSSLHRALAMLREKATRTLGELAV